MNNTLMNLYNKFVALEQEALEFQQEYPTRPLAVAITHLQTARLWIEEIPPHSVQPKTDDTVYS